MNARPRVCVYAAGVVDGRLMKGCVAKGVRSGGIDNALAERLHAAAAVRQLQCINLSR